MEEEEDPEIEQPEIKKFIQNFKKREEPEQTADTIQEQTINSMYVMGLNFISGGKSMKNSYTSLWNILRIMAKRLGEQKYVDELEQIFQGVDVKEGYKVPLTMLEYIVQRDAEQGYFPSKSYNRGKITLTDLMMGLDRAKLDMVNIFTNMTIKYNIVHSQEIIPPEMQDTKLPNL